MSQSGYYNEAPKKEIPNKGPLIQAVSYTVTIRPDNELYSAKLYFT